MLKEKKESKVIVLPNLNDFDNINWLLIKRAYQAQFPPGRDVPALSEKICPILRARLTDGELFPRVFVARMVICCLEAFKFLPLENLDKVQIAITRGLTEDGWAREEVFKLLRKDKNGSKPAKLGV